MKSKEITADSCNSTNIYRDSGEQDDYFYELVLSDDASEIAYTSILENNLNGFDNRSHDFQMIVAENGHGADVLTTAYYFFVELE